MQHIGLLTLAQAAPSGGDAPPAPPAGPSASPVMPGSPAGPGGTTLAPGASSTPTGQPAPSPAGSMLPMILLLVIIGVFLFVSTMGQRKERKKRETLLSSIKKGDKVQTIGGMIGSVVEVRDTDVIVKVDDQSNTRIKFVKSAIQTILENKTES